MSPENKLNDPKWKIHGVALLNLSLQFLRQVPAENFRLLQKTYPAGVSSQIFDEYRGKTSPDDDLSYELNKAILENVDDDIIEKKLGIYVFCNQLRQERAEPEEPQDWSQLQEAEGDEQKAGALFGGFSLPILGPLCINLDFHSTTDQKLQEIENEMVTRVYKGKLTKKFETNFFKILESHSDRSSVPKEKMRDFVKSLIKDSLEYFRNTFDPHDRKYRKKSNSSSAQKESIKGSNKAVKTTKPANITRQGLKEGETYFVPMSEMTKKTRNSFRESARLISKTVVELYGLLSVLGFKYKRISDEEILEQLIHLDPTPAEVIRFKGENSIFAKSHRRKTGAVRPEITELLVLNVSRTSPPSGSPSTASNSANHSNSIFPNSESPISPFTKISPSGSGYFLPQHPLSSPLPSSPFSKELSSDGLPDGYRVFAKSTSDDDYDLSCGSPSPRIPSERATTFSAPLTARALEYQNPANYYRPVFSGLKDYNRARKHFQPPPPSFFGARACPYRVSPVLSHFSDLKTPKTMNLSEKNLNSAKKTIISSNSSNSINYDTARRFIPPPPSPPKGVSGGRMEAPLPVAYSPVLHHARDLKRAYFVPMPPPIPSAANLASLAASMPCYGGGGRGVKRSDNGFGGSFNSSGADNGVGKFNGVGTKKIKDGEGYGSCERRTEFGNTMLSSFIEQQKAGLRLMQRADNMEKIEDNEGSKRAHKIANKMTDKMTQIDDIGAKIGKIRGVKRRIRVFRAPPPPPVTPMMGKTQ